MLNHNYIVDNKQREIASLSLAMISPSCRRDEIASLSLAMTDSSCHRKVSLLQSLRETIVTKQSHSRDCFAYLRSGLIMHGKLLWFFHT